MPLTNRTRYVNFCSALTVLMLAVPTCIQPLVGTNQVFAQTSIRTAGAIVVPPSSDTERFRKALRDHLPVLRFDSDEFFFPVHVNAITNNNGNRLERHDFSELLAERRDGHGLSIRYLRPGTYPTPGGDPVYSDDRVNERGNEIEEHRADVQKFQQKGSSYADLVYGRIYYLRDSSQIQAAWLQYWYFYYYNDYPGLGRFGDHEGDWEMIQIRVDAQARPQFAVYTAHGKGHARAWGNVETLKGRGLRPIVYVALGSHAAYFKPGPCNQDRHVDGGGPPVRGAGCPG